MNDKMKAVDLHSIGLCDAWLLSPDMRRLRISCGKKSNIIGAAYYNVKKKKGFCKLGKQKFLIKKSGPFQVCMYYRQSQFSMENKGKNIFQLKWGESNQLNFEFKKYYLLWFHEATVIDSQGNKYIVPISCHDRSFFIAGILFFLSFLTFNLIPERFYKIVPTNWRADESSTMALIAGVIMLHLVFCPSEYAEGD